MNNIYLLSDKKVDGAISLPIFEVKYISSSIDFSKYDILIFTSKNAIYALDSFCDSWKDIPCVAIAPKTANILKTYGANLIFTGTSGHGDDFANELLPIIKDKKVLYLRGSKVVSNLIEILQCDDIVVYETVCKEFTTKPTIPPYSAIIFSAPSTIKCFLENFTWDKTYKAISIGKTTAKYFPNYITPIISPKTSLESCIEIATEI